jgi:hypothetical protein
MTPPIGRPVMDFEGWKSKLEKLAEQSFDDADMKRIINAKLLVPWGGYGQYGGDPRYGVYVRTEKMTDDQYVAAVLLVLAQ